MPRPAEAKVPSHHAIEAGRSTAITECPHARHFGTSWMVLRLYVCTGRLRTLRYMIADTMAAIQTLDANERRMLAGLCRIESGSTRHDRDARKMLLALADACEMLDGTGSVATDGMTELCKPMGVVTQDCWAPFRSLLDSWLREGSPTDLLATVSLLDSFAHLS